MTKTGYPAKRRNVGLVNLVFYIDDGGFPENYFICRKPPSVKNQGKLLAAHHGLDIRLYGVGRFDIKFFHQNLGDIW